MTLRGLRLDRGLSVEAFAELVDANPASVYYWERTGRRPRDPAVALRVATFFECKTTDLWPVDPPVAA